MNKPQRWCGHGAKATAIDLNIRIRLLPDFDTNIYKRDKYIGLRTLEPRCTQSEKSNHEGSCDSKGYQWMCF